MVPFTSRLGFYIHCDTLKVINSRCQEPSIDKKSAVLCPWVLLPHAKGTRGAYLYTSLGLRKVRSMFRDTSRGESPDTSDAANLLRTATNGSARAGEALFQDQLRGFRDMQTRPYSCYLHWSD